MLPELSNSTFEMPGPRARRPNSRIFASIRAEQAVAKREFADPITLKPAVETEIPTEPAEITENPTAPQFTF